MKTLEQRVPPSSVLLALLTLWGAGAAAAQPSSSFEELAGRWKSDVQGFLRAQSDFLDLSEDEKQAFLRSQGIDQREWRRLGSHVSEWLRTPAGFAAARAQVVDQLEPIEGFDLERYAETSARIAGGRPRDGVLAEAEVGVDTWERVQGGWSTRMGRDRSRVLTTLYSHYFLLGLEGDLAAIARDAARGVLPGGRLEEAEPVPFERYVEVQATLTVGAGRGLDSQELLASKFDLSFADWLALSNWWGVRLRSAEGRPYLARLGRLSQEYEERAGAELAAEMPGAEGGPQP
jgi:hypothetical protein